MINLDRKCFLQQLGLLTAATLLKPERLFASTSTDRTDIQVQDLSIIDLHCHPSLKMYLWGRDMRRTHHPGKGDNDFNQQIDIRTLQPGYVRGMLATHYLVEASVKTHWTKLGAVFWGVKTLFPRLEDKIEHQDYSNFTQINVMIDTLENQVHLANQYLRRDTFVIARSFREFERAIQNGQIPLAHSIEGAHALGRDKPLGLRKNTGYLPIAKKMQLQQNDSTKYIQNLEALKARGVCLITIAHLFENDIAYPCEGIAVNEKRGLGMDWHFDPAMNDYPLKPVGVDVVKKMLDIGIIVDLTHSTPAARKQIFKINRERTRMRPLTFTHVGSQMMFDRYDKLYNNGANKNYGYYSVSPYEIKEICDTEGVIGVVFEDFWLTGCNTHLSLVQRKKFSESIPYIIETILDINSHTNSKKFDNLAIGSDFDGFADAETDLFKPSQLGELISAMKTYPAHAFTDEEIKKIFHLNAMRLLKNGWD